jgi:hypothetical protein
VHVQRCSVEGVRLLMNDYTNDLDAVKLMNNWRPSEASVNFVLLQLFE